MACPPSRPARTGRCHRLRSNRPIRLRGGDPRARHRRAPPLSQGRRRDDAQSRRSVRRAGRIARDFRATAVLGIAPGRIRLHARAALGGQHRLSGGPARKNFLAEPALAASLDIAGGGAEPFEIRGAFRIERPGVLHGIGGWFSSQLSPSVAFSNAPTARHRIDRRNAVLPIDQAVPVEPGDQVSVRIHVIPERWS